LAISAAALEVCTDYHLDFIIINTVEKEEGHLHPIVTHTRKKVCTPDNHHNLSIKVHNINSIGHLIISSSSLAYPVFILYHVITKKAFKQGTFLLPGLKKALNMNNDDFLNGLDSSTPGGGGSSIDNNGGSIYIQVCERNLIHTHFSYQPPCTLA